MTAVGHYMPRGWCPACRGYRAMTKDGLMRKHSSGDGLCAGSGQKAGSP